MIKLTINERDQYILLEINGVAISLDANVNIDYESADSTEIDGYEAILSEKQAWQLTDVIRSELVRMEKQRAFNMLETDREHIKDIQTQSERPVPDYPNPMGAQPEEIDVNKVGTKFAEEEVRAKRGGGTITEIEHPTDWKPERLTMFTCYRCNQEAGIFKQEGEQYVPLCGMCKHKEEKGSASHVCTGEGCCQTEESGENQTSLKKLRAHLEMNKKYGTVCVCPICEDYDKDKYESMIYNRKPKRKGEYVCVTNDCNNNTLSPGDFCIVCQQQKYR